MVVDGRSREGYELEVIKQVRDHGGFSIFWVTENQNRAHAATSLVARRVLVEYRKCSFPWHSYKIIGEK